MSVEFIRTFEFEKNRFAVADARVMVDDEWDALKVTSSDVVPAVPVQDTLNAGMIVCADAPSVPG